jgi:hypothetical protein
VLAPPGTLVPLRHHALMLLRSPAGRSSRTGALDDANATHASSRARDGPRGRGGRGAAIEREERMQQGRGRAVAASLYGT